MSATTALAYNIALTRQGSAEPEHFPTVLVIPGQADAGKDWGELEQIGYTLLLQAIQNLTPGEIPPTVTQEGRPESIEIDESYDDFVPDLEQDGWRVFIEWDTPRDE